MLKICDFTIRDVLDHSGADVVVEAPANSGYINVDEGHKCFLKTPVQGPSFATRLARLPVRLLYFLLDFRQSGFQGSPLQEWY